MKIQPVPNLPAALLIVDMQRAMASANAGERNNLSAEQNMSRLLDHWRKAGHVVVHIRHMSRTPGSGFFPGQPGVEFQEAFAPRDSEHVVEKNMPDAFVNTGLEKWLRVRDITSVVVVGVSTNNSVESTVRTAGCLGFTTQLVADATFAFAKADFNGQWRSADDVHAMSLANLQGEYAQVVATNTLLLSAV
jgi:nicotinamidase-related amidase